LTKAGLTIGSKFKRDTEPDIQLEDESLEHMMIKIVYRHGRYYLSADASHFVEIYRLP